MTYEDISRVNGEIKMLDLKGKDYAMVPERVKAFRKLFPTGFITTEIVSHENGVVLMKAIAGYTEDVTHTTKILGTGFAQEVKGKGMVNTTSYIENCETSAVGRALGFIGLGLDGGGICSAEELVNAITAQKQMQEEQIKRDAPAKVEQVARVPDIPKKEETPELTPVMKYLMDCMKDMREARQIPPAENNKIFKAQREALIKAKMIPDKKLEAYTMDEAQDMVDKMYKCFTPTGTELVTE